MANNDDGKQGGGYNLEVQVPLPCKRCGRTIRTAGLSPDKVADYVSKWESAQPLMVFQFKGEEIIYGEGHLCEKCEGRIEDAKCIIMNVPIPKKGKRKAKADAEKSEGKEPAATK